MTKSFRVPEVSAGDLRVRAAQESGKVRVLAMEMTPEVAFVRKRRDVDLEVRGGSVLPDVEQDVLYVAVLDRYDKSGNKPVAFVLGFGL